MIVTTNQPVSFPTTADTSTISDWLRLSVMLLLLVLERLLVLPAPLSPSAVITPSPQSAQLLHSPPTKMPTHTIQPVTWLVTDDQQGNN